MITHAALIAKIRARWNHYILIGRWKRADRLKRLLQRLEQTEKIAYRKSA